MAVSADRMEPMQPIEPMEPMDVIVCARLLALLGAADMRPTTVDAPSVTDPNVELMLARDAGRYLLEGAQVGVESGSTMQVRLSKSAQ